MNALLTETDEKALKSSQEGRFLRMEINVPRPSLQVISAGMRKLNEEEMAKKKFPPKSGIVWECSFLDLEAGMLKYSSDNSSSLVDALRETSVYPGDTIEITKTKKGLKNVYKIKVTDRTNDEKQAAFLAFVEEKRTEEAAAYLSATQQVQ